MYATGNELYVVGEYDTVDNIWICAGKRNQKKQKSINTFKYYF